MYVGRFVVLGRTSTGRVYLGYRVSSRSFPNRRIITLDDRALVLPTADASPTDNPYIAYNCMRRHAAVTVVANGSHADPIIEKVASGYGLRDAMALSLLALDYERDDYHTPRIAAGYDAARAEGYLGIVAIDRLRVERVTPTAGEALLLATYECTAPTPLHLEGDTADRLADALMACAYEHPVAALAIVTDAEGDEAAARNKA